MSDPIPALLARAEQWLADFGTVGLLPHEVAMTALIRDLRDGLQRQQEEQDAHDIEIAEQEAKVWREELYATECRLKAAEAEITRYQHARQHHATKEPIP